MILPTSLVKQHFPDMDETAGQSGLKITAGRSPVKMTGQLDFSSVKICF